MEPHRAVCICTMQTDLYAITHWFHMCTAKKIKCGYTEELRPRKQWVKKQADIEVYIAEVIILEYIS
jgi:hypothetical protein